MSYQSENDEKKGTSSDDENQSDAGNEPVPGDRADSKSVQSDISRVAKALDSEDDDPKESKSIGSDMGAKVPERRPEVMPRRRLPARDFLHTAAYIPMRLTTHERLLLTVLENALEVCEYTDVVDVTFSHTRKSKHARIIESLVDVLSIGCGLVTSNNLTKGEELVDGRSLTDNVPLFRDLFEVGRRYKIMNPGKMRNTYGKLMYLIMDAESYSIKSETGINFVKEIYTVLAFVKEKGILPILEDELLQEATTALSNADGEKCGAELAAEAASKSMATDALKAKYQSEQVSADDVQRLIDSIADNEAYLNFNALPTEHMLRSVPVDVDTSLEF